MNCQTIIIIYYLTANLQFETELFWLNSIFRNFTLNSLEAVRKVTILNEFPRSNFITLEPSQKSD